MEYRKLGRTDISVSALCLGTMTWGEQNTQAEAFEQMNYSLEQGINFFDTAELYSAPPRSGTYGATEEIIGNWFRETGNRDKVVLASKVTGPSEHMTYMREDGSAPRLDRRNIREAIEGSLRRLQTDYIDLYQLHWPDRNVNKFGTLNFRHDPQENMVHPEETLSALNELVQEGKVRHVGVSNETPWGVMTYTKLAEQGKGPRMVSIQNPYSLLNRSFEVGLAEVAVRENVGLLAYAPLAAGTLTGKYLNGARPVGARMTLFPEQTRYMKQSGQDAVADYLELAEKRGIDPVHMALAFVTSRPFLTSNIFGARTMDQLRHVIKSAELSLSEELLSDLEELGHRHTFPCP
ncbi:NADP(H)-dependent aldo-keto reductase [Kiloniella sp. b19]|uniref:NADP(H)-dependent aldo-keto reductase n=1 Tax=Kiloniella sp. GXU_MW_B19 TaxID=3141326 RepID=UPI0031D60070